MLPSSHVENSVSTAASPPAHSNGAHTARGSSPPPDPLPSKANPHGEPSKPTLQMCVGCQSQDPWADLRPSGASPTSGTGPGGKALKTKRRPHLGRRAPRYLQAHTHIHTPTPLAAAVINQLAVTNAGPGPRLPRQAPPTRAVAVSAPAEAPYTFLALATRKGACSCRQLATPMW